jgi:hypothetical protein
MNYKKRITLDTKDGIRISLGYQGANVVELFIYDEEDEMLTNFMLSAEVLEDIGVEMAKYGEFVRKTNNG